MTIYQIAAPKIAGLLPAWASPTPAPARPLAALTSGEQAVLLTAYEYQQARQAGTYAIGTVGAKAADWMPVSPATRPAADILVEYGYLEKAGGRNKRWYTITEDGALRAASLLEESDDQDTLPDGAPRQMALEHRRRLNLRALTAELAHRGYALLAEDGRGAGRGEQAFYNVFTGDTLLYRCGIGSDRWTLRAGGYYQNEYALSLEQEFAQVPF